MSATAYGDESYIHSKKAPCYGIGCFLIPSGDIEHLERQLSEIRLKYRINHELKWNHINHYRADLEAAFEGVTALLASGATFHSMMVHKASFRKWRSNPEEAFYTSYYQLAINVIAHAGQPVELVLDHRTDKYPRQAEVLGIIANHALARISGSAMVSKVSMIDSKTSIILQMADVLLGAITADTNRVLNRGVVLGEGKQELIRRFAQMVGWKRLCYDTKPNQIFNIWHFPIEFRAIPSTEEIDPVWLQQTVTA